jgi:hypothetical protein
MVFAAVGMAGVFAVGFVAFMGYVAYSGNRPLLEALDGPPRTGRPTDPAQLGALFDAGLAWGMRVAGCVLVLTAAAMALVGALLRRPPEEGGTAVLVLLTGCWLVSPHWAVALAAGLFGAALVLLHVWRRAPAAPPPGEDWPVQPGR